MTSGKIITFNPITNKFEAFLWLSLSPKVNIHFICFLGKKYLLMNLWHISMYVYYSAFKIMNFIAINMSGVSLHFLFSLLKTSFKSSSNKILHFLKKVLFFLFRNVLFCSLVLERMIGWKRVCLWQSLIPDRCVLSVARHGEVVITIIWSLPAQFIINYWSGGLSRCQQHHYKVVMPLLHQNIIHRNNLALGWGQWLK